MTKEKQARFLLPDGLRQSAERGEHNFLAKVAKVLGDAGYSVSHERIDAGPSDNGTWTLLHMQEPENARTVTVRRAYHYPFWQIERTNERWNWDVARAEFDVAGADRKEIDRFWKFWRKRLFSDGPDRAVRGDFVYVPLQGRLRQHRSFQSCAPIRMVETVLERSKGRSVVAGLHPRETYCDADLSELESLQQRHGNLEVQMGSMETLLTGCDFVVTQNSSVAFSGLFFAKPSILFAEIDFHHACISISKAGVENAFNGISAHSPDYPGYVWWFLQKMSINAGRPKAEQKIADRLQALGWPM